MLFEIPIAAFGIFLLYKFVHDYMLHSMLQTPKKNPPKSHRVRI